jgi:predicted nuclease of restriction endonuclease-like RecB superfamily
MRRAAPDWDVIEIREPEPVRAGAFALFPDFALVHRRDERCRWLEQKLTQYRSAELENLILCIDDERMCAEGDLPSGDHVVRFRRRVDAMTVLGSLPAPKRDV